MKIEGLPEKFWVVTKPSPVSTLTDVCFACTFPELMNQVRGGLKEDDIVGIYEDEDDARLAARELLGDFPVRPCDALAVEVVVHVLAIPNSQDMLARDLAKAAAEAVRNALRRAEQEGHEHWLKDRISLGTGEVVEVKNMATVIG